jgi:hypothetical protein
VRDGLGSGDGYVGTRGGFRWHTYVLCVSVKHDGDWELVLG